MKASFSFTAAFFGALLSSGLISASPVPESGIAAGLEKRCSDDAVIVDYLATNSSISYSSGWTVLRNQGNRDQGGVEAYSNNPCAYYTVDIPISSGSFVIFAGKKFDRGYFDVYIGDTYVGTGDAYDASCKSNCQSTDVFDIIPSEDINYIGQTVTVRNRQSDSRLGGKTPYIDINNILFSPPNC